MFCTRRIRQKWPKKRLRGGASDHSFFFDFSTFREITPLLSKFKKKYSISFKT